MSKAAELAQAAIEKSSQIEAHVVSKKAALDYATNLAKGSDTPLQRGITDVKYSLSELSSLLENNPQELTANVLAKQQYDFFNPGSLSGQRLSAAFEQATDAQGNKQSVGATAQGVGDVLSLMASDVAAAQSPMDKLRAAYDDVSALGGGIVKQLPNSAVAMAGMGAGALVGSLIAPGVGTVAGMMLGATAGNMGVGQSEAIQNLMAKQGIDQSNPQALAQFFQQNRGQLLQDNAIKSGIIGAVDTATLGLTGAVLNAPLKAATNRALTAAGIDIADTAAVQQAMKLPAIRQAILQDAEYVASKQGNLAQSVGLMGADMTAEGVGEYTGQGVATGDWNIKDAFSEAISSMGQSGGEHAIQKTGQFLADQGLKTAQAVQSKQAEKQTEQAAEEATKTGDASAFTNPEAETYNPELAIHTLTKYHQDVVSKMKDMSEGEVKQHSAKIEEDVQAIDQIVSKEVETLQGLQNNSLESINASVERQSVPGYLEQAIKANGMTEEDLAQAKALLAQRQELLQSLDTPAKEAEYTAQLNKDIQAQQEKITKLDDAKSQFDSTVFPQVKIEDTVENGSGDVIVNLMMASKLTPNQHARALKRAEDAIAAGQSDLFTEQHVAALRLLKPDKKGKDSAQVTSDIYTDLAGNDMSLAKYGKEFVKAVNTNDTTRSEKLVGMLTKFGEAHQSKLDALTQAKTQFEQTKKPVYVARDASKHDGWAIVPKPKMTDAEIESWRDNTGSIIVSGKTFQDSTVKGPSLFSKVTQEVADIQSTLQNMEAFASLATNTSTPNDTQSTTTPVTATTTATSVNTQVPPTISTVSTNSTSSNIDTGTEPAYQGLEVLKSAAETNKAVSAIHNKNLTADVIKQNVSEANPLTSVKDFVDTVDANPEETIKASTDISTVTSEHTAAVKKFTSLASKVHDTVSKNIQNLIVNQTEKGILRHIKKTEAEKTNDPFIDLLQADSVEPLTEQQIADNYKGRTSENKIIGKAEGLKVEKNLSTAMTAAIMNAVQSIKSLSFDNKAVNKKLGRSEHDIVTAAEQALLGKQSIPSSVLQMSLGKDMTKALGIEAKDGTIPYQYMEKLQASLGKQALNVMRQMNLIKPDSESKLSKAALKYANKGEALDIDLDSFLNRTITGANEQAKTAQINSLKNEYSIFHELTDSPEVDEILDSLKGSGNVLGKMFSVLRPEALATTEAEAWNAVNKAQTPKSIQETLKQDAEQEHRISYSVWNAFAGLTETGVKKLMGYKEIYDENMNPLVHKDLIKSYEGQIFSITQQIEGVKSFLADHLTNEEYEGKVQNIPIFYQMKMNKSQRVNITNQQINPQSHKYTRALLTHKSWEAEIRFDDTEKMAKFNIMAAINLDLSPDELTQELQNPDSVIKQAVDALVKNVRNPEYKFSATEQESIIAAIEKREGLQSFQALVELANREAVKDKAESFTTNLSVEVDGKTNGVIIGMLLFGTMDAAQMGKFLEKGGIYSVNNLDFFDDWKRGNPDAQDIYMTVAAATIKHLETYVRNGIMNAKGKVLVNKEKVLQTLQAVAYFTGDMKVGSSPSKIMRDLVKYSVLTPFFGSTLTTAANRMSSDFVEIVLEKINTIATTNSTQQERAELVHYLDSLASLGGFDSHASISGNITSDDLLGIKNRNADSVELDSSYFNKSLYTAIFDAHSKVLGAAVKEGLQDIFQPFLDKTKVLNDSAQILSNMYVALVQDSLKLETRAETLKYLQEDGTAGTPFSYASDYEHQDSVSKAVNPLDKNQTDKTRVASQSISKSSYKKMLVELKKYAPVLNSAASMNDKNSDAAMLLAKFGETSSADPASSFVADIHTGTEEADRNWSTARVREHESIGIASVSRAIHSFDSAIMMKALKNVFGEDYFALNIFDAVLTGHQNIEKAAKALNKAFLDLTIQYSPLHEMYLTAERMLTNLVKDSKVSEQMLNSLAELRKDDDFISYREHFTSLFHAARLADINKLQTLAEVRAVNQYSFKGGQHTLNADDWLAIEYKLIDVEERQMSFEFLDILDRLDELDAIRTQQLTGVENTTSITTSVQAQTTVAELLKVISSTAIKGVTFTGELVSAVQKIVPSNTAIIKVSQPLLTKIEKGLPTGLSNIQETVIRNSFGKGKPNPKGLFSTEGGVSTIFLRTSNNNSITHELVMHELVHAASHYLIEVVTNPELKDKKALLSQSQIQAVDKLNQLFKEVKAQATTEQQEVHSEALSSLHEFMSYSLTDATFQKIMLGMEIKAEPKNWTQRFKTFISNLGALLNLTSISQKSALGKVVQAAFDVLAESKPSAKSPVSVSLPMADSSFYMTGEIFTALDSNQLSTGFKKHLESLLDSVVTQLHGPFGSLKASIQAASKQSAWNELIVTKSAKLVSELQTAGLHLDQQQAYVMEQVYISINGINADNEVNTFKPYKELTQLYKSVQQSMTANDLLGSAFGTTTLNEAQKLHDALFKVNKTISNKSDYLARFAAISLTNEGIMSWLEAHQQSDSKAKQSWAQKLQNIFEDILAYIHSWMNPNFTSVGPKNANYQINKIVQELVDIETNQQKVLNRKLAAEKSQIRSVEERLNNIAKAVTGKVLDIADLDFIQNSKYEVVKAVGNLTSTVIGHRVNEFLQQLLEINHLKNPGKLGLIAGLINNVKGQSEVLELLLLGRTNLDRQRKEQMTLTSKFVLQAFKDQGTSLTKTQKSVITKAFLKTGMHALLTNYSLSDIESMMKNPSEIGTHIQTEIQKLSSLPQDVVNRFIENANGLGFYAATGKIHVEYLKDNSHQIVHNFGEGNNRLTQKQLNIAQEIVDTLLPLFALKYTNSADLTTAAEILNQENQRTDGNGVATILTLHAHLAQVEKDYVNDGHAAFSTFGNIHETFNPRTKIIAANTVDGQKLIDLGYQRAMEIKRDPHDPDQSAKHYYILKHGSLSPWQGSIVGIGSDKSTDDEITSGYMDIDNPNGRINAAIHAKINSKRAQNKSVRKAQNPLRDLSQEADMNLMAPVYDEEGSIVNWTYKMPEVVKNNLLERMNDFDHVLGSLTGSLNGKHSTVDHNKLAIQALFDDYKESSAYSRTQYVMVGPKSTVKEQREIWALLPDQTKADAMEIYGSEHIMVHKNSADMVFGYRKVSMADPFHRANKERDELIEAGKPANISDLQSISMLQKGVISVVEDMLKYSAMARGMSEDAALRYSKRAVTYVARGEAIWQELVSDMKDKIVVVSGSVLVGNIFSNISRLMLEGIPLKNIVHYSLVALRGAMQYTRDKAELDSLKLKQSLQAISQQEERQIAILQDAIARNPTTSLIESGLMPTIVEDLDADTEVAYKSMLGEQIDKLSKGIPEPALNALKFGMMTRESGAYKALSHITQMSDFVARYTMYQHQTTKSENPMSHKDAVARANNAFIQYAVPMHRMMQYSDDMGFTLFTKYFLYVQRELFRLSKEQPGRVMTMLLLNKFIHLGPVITDSSLFHHIGNDPFRTGAFEWMNAYEKLLTTKASLALIH